MDGFLSVQEALDEIARRLEEDPALAEFSQRPRLQISGADRAIWLARNKSGIEDERVAFRHDPEQEFYRQPRRDEFLDRVAEVCAQRHPGAVITPYHGPDLVPYLRVCASQDGFADVFPVGAFGEGLTLPDLQRFLAEVDAEYRKSDPRMRSVLVYGGSEGPAPEARSIHWADEKHGPCRCPSGPRSQAVNVKQRFRSR